MFINLAHTIKTFLLMGFAFARELWTFPSDDSTSALLVPQLPAVQAIMMKEIQAQEI